MMRDTDVGRRTQRTAHRIAAVLSAAALVFHPAAHASEVRISGSDCGSGVHVFAQDARLSEVLKRLARTLGFQLSFESDSDPLVTFDQALPSSELVMRLAPLENVMIEKARDPRCQERERIVKVWVLHKGNERGGLRAVASNPLPTPDQRAAREGANHILQAHGLPPIEDAPENPQ